METVERLDGASLDVAAEKRRELLELFPEVRTEDDKIDFDRLKLALGESVDAGKERYGLTWPGKAECFKAIQAPSMATLLPCPDKSVNFDSTENLIIEGDNLEVLKLLQKSYLGKIKMIYIDPPYNTGNDFIYPDDYSESLQTYLQYTGQVDAAGRKFGTNSDTEGRFHSKWLNMMYPRLYLSRNLLENDGLLVAQIDDVELVNLRRLLDDIFGEENYINTVAVKSKLSAGASGGGEDKRLKKNVEYLLVYARDYGAAAGFFQSFSEEPLMDLIADMRETDQSWKYTSVLLDEGTRERRCTTVDGEGNPIEIFVHNGIKRAPLSEVCASESLDEATAYKKYLARIFSDTNAQTSIRSRVIEAAGPLGEGQMYSVEYVPGSGRDKGKRVTHWYVSPSVRRVIWLSDVAFERDGGLVKRERTGTLWDTIRYNNVGKEGGIPFPNGKKPVELIRRVISLLEERSSIVLDFFSGSGTTGEAVLRQNREDGGTRKFILVQLPEPIEDSEFKTVADLCQARMKHVTQQHIDERDGMLSLRADGGAMNSGFRVFRLAQSNVKEWDSTIPRDPDVLAAQLEMSVDHLRHDRTDLDIVYEVLLKSGFPLSSKLAEETIADKRVYSVADGAFLICLDRHLTLELIRAIADRNPERVLVLDEGFAGNDQLKTNAVQTFNTKNVTFRTL